MTKKSIILVGGGGHCTSCIDVIEQEGKYEILGILDLPERIGLQINGYPIIGTDDEIVTLVEECKLFCITVGQIKSAKIREKIYQQIKAVGGELPIIISPNAYVSKHATIEEGTIIMHQATINANAKIGKCCIINSKALIEHEVNVGDFCHVSTASVINGQTQIGSQVFIGSNSIIVNNIHINSEVIIAAGSRIFKSKDKKGTYYE